VSRSGGGGFLENFRGQRKERIVTSQKEESAKDEPGGDAGPGEESSKGAGVGLGKKGWVESALWRRRVTLLGEKGSHAGEDLHERRGRFQGLWRTVKEGGKERVEGQSGVEGACLTVIPNGAPGTVKEKPPLNKSSKKFLGKRDPVGLRRGKKSSTPIMKD